MARIKTDLVASGVIGKFDRQWKVLRLYDCSTNESCYDLYVEDEAIGSFGSVVDSLDVLVDMFKE